MSRINPFILRFLAASAIALAVPVTALAAPPSGHNRPPVRLHVMMRMLHGLNLTESQRTQIKSLLEAQSQQTRMNIQQMREQRQSLRALALSDHYDVSVAKAGADKLARAEADMTKQRMDTMHKVYTLLTPAQKAQIKDRAHSHPRFRAPKRNKE